MDEKNSYPEWKRQLWKAVRVFTAAFVGVLLYDVAQKCSLEYIDTCLQSYASTTVLVALSKSAVIAGCAAIGNWWRAQEKYNYESAAYKSIL